MAEEKEEVKTVGYMLIKQQRANNTRWQCSCQRRDGIHRERLAAVGKFENRLLRDTDFKEQLDKGRLDVL